MTSSDGETWQELAVMPRRDLSDAPAVLIVGHGNRADGILESYHFISFYDELILLDNG